MNKKNYNKLLQSGMFWEFHPELSGNWEKDKNKFTDASLDQAIKKAKPNLDKIKDVDRHLDDIRG